MGHGGKIDGNRASASDMATRGSPAVVPNQTWKLLVFYRSVARGQSKGDGVVCSALDGSFDMNPISLFDKTRRGVA